MAGKRQHMVLHVACSRVGVPSPIRHVPWGWWLSGGAHLQLDVPLRGHLTSCRLLTAPFDNWVQMSKTCCATWLAVRSRASS